MSWQPDTGNSGWTTDGASGGGDAWNDVQTDGVAFTNGEFSARNTSKHADSVIGEPPDGGCRICHSDAHFARDCPEKPANSGLCYGCGEPGHNRADCPSKSAEKCRICDGNGHIAKECPENRLLLQLKALNLGEVSAKDAWDMLGKADEDKEIEDFKRALLLYARGCFRDGQECTFEILEQCFRDANMNTYLIAKQQTVPETHIIVSLDGKPGQEYVVSFQFSPNPRRKAFKEGWPSSVEENLDRLSKAGFIMDSMIPKCRNCGGMGHVRTNCSEDKAEAPKIAITCANCNEEGHRARDCQQPRKSNKKGCRNCGGEDHIAKECPEPPNPDNVECRNCGENGHFSKDCPTREPDLCRNCGQEGHRAKDCTEERVMKCRNCEQYGHAARECTQPKDMTKVQCRNCDEMGHQSRECPKPTDWSRVTCTNCNEKGHSYKRCQNPAASANDETGGGDDDGDGWGAGETSGGSGGWGAEATSGGDW